MASPEIAQISGSIRAALGESAGTFRKAANDNNASIVRMMKDLSKAFAQQRTQIAGLSDAIQEVSHHTQETNSKLDRLLSLMADSVSIQSQMASNMKNVNDGIFSSNRTLSGLLTSIGGFGDVGVLGKLSKIIEVLQLIGLGAAGVAAGAGAAKVISDELGGRTAAAGGIPGGGMPTGKGLGESGSSSEAMSFFQSKGWTKEQAAGIVGNLQAESGKNLRTDAVGDSGQAYGIAQWHPDRQRKFQEVMGIPIRQANFKQQLEFVQWELTNTEKRAGQMLKNAGSSIEAARAIDYGYERSTHEHLGQRMANAMALSKSENSAPSATPASKGDQGTSPKVPGAIKADAEKVQGQDQHTSADAHHHIISGAEEQAKQDTKKADTKADATKVQATTGDTSALGGKSLSGVNSDLTSKLAKAAAEYKQKTGKAVNVTSGLRTKEKQQELYDAYRSGRSSIPANPPGKSNHETGNAVDVSQDQARAMESMGILSKYGLSRPLGEKDPVHIQLAGTGTSQDSYSSGGTGPGSGATTPSSGGGGETTSGGMAGVGAAGPDMSAVLNSAAARSITGGAGLEEFAAAAAHLASGVNAAPQAVMEGAMPTQPVSGLSAMGSTLGVMDVMGGGLPGLLNLFSGLGNLTGDLLKPETDNVSKQNMELKQQAIAKETDNIPTAQQPETKKETDNAPVSTPWGRDGLPTSTDYNHPKDKGWPEWLGKFQYAGYDSFMGKFIHTA